MNSFGTEIYVVTHKEYEGPQINGYSPILVGADLNKANIPLKDNIEINISSKNREFNELTAQYWVWKNALNRSKNIGFVHYRRFFYSSMSKSSIVPVKQFSTDLANYDIVLPEPWKFRKTIAQQYKEFHHINDLLLARSVIANQFPQYLSDFDAVMQSHTLSCFNMFVMPSNLFSNYMDWLFSILFKVEKKTDLSLYDSYNRRIYGFLSERLLNVWVKYQSLSCKYYPVYKNDGNWYKEIIRQKIGRVIGR